MDELLAQLFYNFSRMLSYTHILSFGILTGLLFSVVAIMKPILYHTNIPKERYEKGAIVVRYTLLYSSFFMAIIFVGGYIMSVGLGLEKGNPATYVFVHALEALWAFMGVNFVYIYLKYKSIKKSLKVKEYTQVHENLELIFNYMVPLNLFICIVSVYFGVVLRGF